MSWGCLEEVAETNFVVAHWDIGVNEIPDRSSQFSHSNFGVLHNLALFDLFVFKSRLLCQWFRGILFRLSIIESNKRSYIIRYIKTHREPVPTHLLLCGDLLLSVVDLLAELVQLEINYPIRAINTLDVNIGVRSGVRFTHSSYMATTSSTISVESPRLRCDSRIDSAFPPFLSMNSSTSSVMASD